MGCERLDEAPVYVDCSTIGETDDCDLDEQGAPDRQFVTMIPAPGLWTFSLCGTTPPFWDSQIFIGEAVVWQLASTPVATGLGFLPGSSWSRAHAINDADPAVVVGQSSGIDFCFDTCNDPVNPNAVSIGFTTAFDQTPDLVRIDPFACYPSSLAIDVNTPPTGLPQIVGFSHRGQLGGVEVCDTGCACMDCARAAGGQFVDAPVMMSQIDPKGSEARGVNDAGNIVGFGFRTSNLCRKRTLFWSGVDNAFINLGEIMPEGQGGNQSLANAISNVLPARLPRRGPLERNALLTMITGRNIDSGHGRLGTLRDRSLRRARWREGVTALSPGAPNARRRVARRRSIMSRTSMFDVAIAILAGVIAQRAGAGVSEIKERDVWTGAVGAFRTVDFTGFPDGTYLSDQYADLGILFTDRDDNVFLNDNLFLNDGAGATSCARNSFIKASFDVPQSCVAVDFPPFVAFELYRGDSLIYRSRELTGGRSGNGQFAGLISDDPFDAIAILDPAGCVNIDDLHFAVGTISARKTPLNSGFEREGASGPRVTFTGSGVGPESAAADWLIVNEGEGTTTTTALDPSTLTGGQSFMLHVVTDGAESGIVQDLFPAGSGPDCGLGAAWVQVIRGAAFVSVETGEEEGAIDPASRRFNRRKYAWERLDLLNVECPARRITIRSGPEEGGAEFFVDHAAFGPFCPCAPDLDNSRWVDVDDIVRLFEAWGPNRGCRADFDGDGDVGAMDLLELLVAWGQCAQN